MMFVVAAADGNDWWNLCYEWSPRVNGGKTFVVGGEQSPGSVFLQFSLRLRRVCVYICVAKVRSRDQPTNQSKTTQLRPLQLMSTLQSSSAGRP